MKYDAGQLEKFLNDWTEIENKLAASPDLPSVLTRGSLLEQKVASIRDSAIQVNISDWRATTLDEVNPANIQQAYTKLKDSLWTRVRIERATRHETETVKKGAAAKIAARSQSEGGIPLARAHAAKGGGKGKKGICLQYLSGSCSRAANDCAFSTM